MMGGKSRIVMITLFFLLAVSISQPSYGAAVQNTAEILAISQDPATDDTAPRWSADSLSVLFFKYTSPGDGSYKTVLYKSSLDSVDTPQLLLEWNTLIYSPTLSPDSTRIAYIDQERILSVIDMRGETLLQFADVSYNSPIVWSPDSSRLLVTQQRGEVYVVAVDGSSPIQLDLSSLEWSDYGSPVSWSPDSKKLLLAVSGDIYAVSVDESGQVNLTHSEGRDVAPSWSPDGSKIAFVSNGDYKANLPPSPYASYTLYSMKPDGSEITRLTDTQFTDICPSWSPDGAKLAFVRTEQIEGGTVFLLDMNTLTTSWLNRPDGKFTTCASWSPNGEWLVFDARSEETSWRYDLYAAPGDAFKSNVLDAESLYQVSFVPEDDVLNVRTGPGVQFEAVDSLGNGHKVRLTGVSELVGSDTWVEIAYQGGKTGWVNRLYLMGNLDPVLFCDDSRLLELITELRNAVRNRDGDMLASLIAPHGIYMALYSGEPLYLTVDEVRNLFDDTTLRNWGHSYGEEDRILSLADEIASLMQRDLLPENINIACNDNQDGLSITRILYALHMPGYESPNFYSVMRPGAPGYELDWGAWGLGIEYWNGQPVLMGLAYYYWTP